MSELGRPFLHPDVRRLIEDDRLAPDPPDAVKRRVAHKVDRTLGLGGALFVAPLLDLAAPRLSDPAPLPVVPPSFFGWKAVTGAAVAVVVGGVVALSLGMRSQGPAGGRSADRIAVHQELGQPGASTTRSPWDTDTELRAALPVNRATSDSSPRAREVDLAADHPAARRSAAGAHGPSVHKRAALRHGAGTSGASGSFDSLAAERTVLDRARAALLRRDGAAALAALRSHQHTFPRGQLVEERESMRVQAFALTRDADAVAAAAERFKHQFPRSMFLPAVEQAAVLAP